MRIGYEPKSGNVTVDWRKFHNEEFYYMFTSQNVILVLIFVNEYSGSIKSMDCVDELSLLFAYQVLHRVSFVCGLDLAQDRGNFRCHEDGNEPSGFIEGEEFHD